MARRISILLGILLSAVFLVVVWAFSCGWSATNEAWRAEITGKPRPPAQMRGILTSMLAARKVAAPPAFIPMSMWDDDVCAAAVVNAVNFIAGDERLKVAPAWMFSRANADALTVVYSREQDFAIKDGRVVETHDRPIWLSSKMRMAGEKPQRTAAALYIVGYLYHQTRSHELIARAGADLNSHLMLILGRSDGSWWGYHLLHDPVHPERNPFRIDDLGEQMPADFDLIYIWEVKDTEMPAQGAPMLLASRAPRYEEVLPWIGWGFNGKVEYGLDTALAALRFGRREQFPRAVKANTAHAKSTAHNAPASKRRSQTAAFCEQHPRSCSPVPIKQVKVERGKWPEWYVRRTGGANIHATADCNGWPRGTSPVIRPGSEINICGW